MKVVKIAKEEPSGFPLALAAPVSTPRGSFCAPLYTGVPASETLGLQLGPASITGLVQTPHVCYLDLTLNDQQIARLKQLEASILGQLPGHKTVWFTRDMQTADIEYFYDSCIRGNVLRASVLRCSTFDTIDVQVFQESGELGPIDLIEKSATVLALVHVQGVSHCSGRLAIDWVVQQVLAKRDSACRIDLGATEPASDAAPPSQRLPPLGPPPGPPPLGPPAATTATRPSSPPLAPPPSPHMPSPASEPPPPSGEAAAGVTEVFDADAFEHAGTDITLRPENELISDELDELAREERDRRALALRIFMEANGLDRDAYDFPDTDEESDGDIEDSEDGEDETSAASAAM